MSRLSRWALACVVFFVSCSLSTLQLSSKQNLPITATDTTSFDAWSFNPKDNYRPMWEYVKLCSGIKPKKGGDYKDIHWQYASPGTMGDMMGVWIPPDTIVLDSLYLQAPWVIQHELLHHLMQPKREENKHPDRPFRWPCMLTVEQSVPPRDWMLRSESPDGTGTSP